MWLNFELQAGFDQLRKEGLAVVAVGNNSSPLVTYRIDLVRLLHINSHHNHCPIDLDNADHRGSHRNPWTELGRAQQGPNSAELAQE